MCYSYQLVKKLSEIQQRFNIENAEFINMDYPFEVNGFAHPQMPVIWQEQIVSARWGLIPHWVKELKTFKANTLNARNEELKLKPSFRSSINNRCIIPATGFYEWHWLDPKGKQKEKYLMSFESLDIFTFPGLYSDWKEPETGNIIRTYTLLTTAGTGLMKEIHNNDPDDPRMVMVLNPEFEKEFLENGTLEIINDLLKAEKIS